MLVDSHLHTHYSSDCQLSPRQVAEQLKIMGLKGVITDHYDFDHTEGDHFTFDVEEFLEDTLIKRQKNLGRGIEMGLRPELRERFEGFAARKEFDCLLGSVHYEYREGVLFDFTKSHGLGLVDFYTKYWRSMVDAVEDNGYIHVFAHVDYPTRYIGEYGGDIPLGAVANLIQECFRIMARKEISLELNTRRLNERQARLQWQWLLRAFRESGGETVTFGSDAHTLQAIGRHFDVALELAKEAELTPVYYKDGMAYPMSK
ncbi:MAG TPA: hypothetical protein GX733_00970 [Tissierellia bacterium]|nr:hypothetical protein [Tissierellia bacterium]